MGENRVRVAQHDVAVLKDRHKILSRNGKDFFPLGPKVRNDDLVIGQLQVGQLLPDDLAFGAPLDVVQGHRAVSSRPTAQGTITASFMPWITFLSAGQTVARIPASSAVSPLTK